MGDDLSEQDKLTVERARKLQRFLSQPFTVAQVFTGIEGKLVDLKAPSDPSRASSTASATTCLRVLSTWLATSRAHAPRVRRFWQTLRSLPKRSSLCPAV